MKLGDVLLRNKEQIVLENSTKYKQVTVRMWNKGVYLRDEVYGSDIKSSKRFLVSKGQFIISKIDARHGAFGMIPVKLHGAVITADFLSYNINSSLIIPEYFHWFFSQRKFTDLCSKASSGTTNRIRLKEDKFLDIEIELPSLKEQRKKLNKIESINNIDKKLGKNFNNDKLLITKLRQAILSEAVQGKLVPQDPNDEPASILLRKIRKEKERLIKEEKIKKEKSLPPISEDEIPYELPKGWEWIRVNELGCIGTGATPESTNPQYYQGNIPWITSASTNNLFITKSEKCITEKALNETNCKIFPKQTLIIAMYGQGKTRGQVSELLINAATNQACAAIVFSNISIECKDYVKLVFRKIYDKIREIASGGAQPNLNLVKVKLTPLPLPPLNEQRRIVQKVDQLMTLCDQLESQVKKNQKNSEALMSAVLRETFESVPVGSR